MAKPLQPLYEIPPQAVRVHAVEIVPTYLVVVLAAIQHVISGDKNTMAHGDNSVASHVLGQSGRGPCCKRWLTGL